MAAFETLRIMAIEKCHRCVDSLVTGAQIAAECLPVPCFGDLSSANLKVVTVGLNPALNEFYQVGIPKERERRLALLGDYECARRINLSDEDIMDAQKRRKQYFSDSKRGWHTYFEKMEALLTNVHSSWNFFWGSAVHIDLVACATKERWSKLAPSVQEIMVENCQEFFLDALKNIPDGVVILCDGKRIVSEMTNLPLNIQWRPKQLIQIHPENGPNLGCVGDLVIGCKKHKICGWDSYIAHMNPTWRIDLAHWVHNIIFPNTPDPGLAALK